MRMWLTRGQAETPAWTLHTEDVFLVDRESLAAWESELFVVLERALGKRRVPLLVDMAGFRLDPSLASLYGPIAKRVLTGFATAIVRYSPEGMLTTTGIRTAAIKAGFASNICDSRQAALALMTRALESAPPSA